MLLLNFEELCYVIDCNYLVIVSEFECFFTDMRDRSSVGCLMWMQDATRISMVGRVGPKGPSIKYVTLFFYVLATHPPPCNAS